MNHGIDAWIIVFSIATAFLVLVQVVVLAVMAFMLRRGFLEFRAFQRRLHADGISLYQLILDAHALLGEADQALQKGLELGDAVNMFIVKSTSLLNRAEDSVGQMRRSVDAKWARVLHSVAEPVYRFRAAAAGVRALVDGIGHRINGR